MRRLACSVALGSLMLIAGAALADVLVVAAPEGDLSARPMGINLTLPDAGQASVSVSEGNAEQTPGIVFVSLADAVARFGFELVAPMTGGVVMTDGDLTGAQFDLVLLRHREPPEGDSHDDELFDVFVTGTPTAKGTVLLEVKGFSRTERAEEPDFIGVFEAWVQP